jgi:hypothetical protein
MVHKERIEFHVREWYWYQRIPYRIRLNKLVAEPWSEQATSLCDWHPKHKPEAAGITLASNPNSTKLITGSSV